MPAETVAAGAGEEVGAAAVTVARAGVVVVVVVVAASGSGSAMSATDARTEEAQGLDEGIVVVGSAWPFCAVTPGKSPIDGGAAAAELAEMVGSAVVTAEVVPMAVAASAVFVVVASVVVVVVVATGMGTAVQQAEARTLEDGGTGCVAVLLLSKILLVLVRPGGDASQGSLASDATRSRSAFSAAAVVSRAWIFFSRTICFASRLELHSAILALSAVRVMLECCRALATFVHSPSTAACNVLVGRVPTRAQQRAVNTQ